jgi:hypothetical protein
VEVFKGSAGTVDLLIDVFGYFAKPLARGPVA